MKYENEIGHFTIEILPGCTKVAVSAGVFIKHELRGRTGIFPGRKQLEARKAGNR